MPASPLDAARRYGRPAAGTGNGHPAGAVAPIGGREVRPESTLPRTLGIIGIVCAFVLMPAALVLGVIGHYLAHKHGQPVTYPRAAWILSLVVTVVAVTTNACAHTMFAIG